MTDLGPAVERSRAVASMAHGTQEVQYVQTSAAFNRSKPRHAAQPASGCAAWVGLPSALVDLVPAAASRCRFACTARSSSAPSCGGWARRSRAPRGSRSTSSCARWAGRSGGSARARARPARPRRRRLARGPCCRLGSSRWILSLFATFSPTAVRVDTSGGRPHHLARGAWGGAGGARRESCCALGPGGRREFGRAHHFLRPSDRASRARDGRAYPRGRLGQLGGAIAGVSDPPPAKGHPRKRHPPKAPP